MEARRPSYMVIQTEKDFLKILPYLNNVIEGN